MKGKNHHARHARTEERGHMRRKCWNGTLLEEKWHSCKRKC
jgi:hypothetical protein